MSSYVGVELRRLVIVRAKRVCEYCLIHEDDTFFGCEVDHVISEKHGGLTEAENLAFACFNCNRRKGSDVGSITSITREFVRLFNPRTDRWADHFFLDEVMINGKTDNGDVTARLLGFNDIDRTIERSALRDVGRYPTRDAAYIAAGLTD